MMFPKKIFILLIVVGIGGLTIVKAQGLDGTPCVGEWAKKRVCDGPTRVVQFECVSANCHWRADKDRCDDEQTKCESACRQENDACVCKPDSNLGTHLQYTYVDKVYTSCKDACGAKSVRCFSGCSTAWAACDKAAADASAACRKKLSWEKSGEFPCEEGMKCTERASGAACLYPPSAPAVRVPESALPAAGEPVSEEVPIAAPRFAAEPDLSLFQQELDQARELLEKIKQNNDPRWANKKDYAVDYGAELDRLLNSLEQDPSKRVMQKKEIIALRKKIEDIHDILSSGNDWFELPETLESIKKGEAGEYGKLDLFTDSVKSFNDYNDLRAKGVSMEDASTKAVLDNYGATIVTTVPVLSAIELGATTPDLVLNTFGVDEDHWSRKYVTDGFIGKFAPSGVIKQTTDLMLENKWSDIGNALSYQWGKVQSANGVLGTAKETGKLVVGTVGAVPVAFARAMSQTTAATVYVGQTALEFAGKFFSYPHYK